MTKAHHNTLPIGAVLDDKWVILELIGRGGMGEVYRAYQLNLKRDIALKVISQEWLESLEDEPEEVDNALHRFRREVQAMAQIRHVNVVQVYDQGTLIIKMNDHDIPIEYIAMEYVPGADLRATMPEQGFYPDEEAVRNWLRNYFLPVIRGVRALHQAGIIHRDLKPHNVLLDGTTPKIVDLGLARSCKLEPVTRSMDVKGTPPYMSPEQFYDFGRVDERADIYALGKILYEAVDGKIPHGATPFQKATLANTKTAFFEKLDRIIQKTTEPDKKLRIASAAELQEVILQLTGHTREVQPSSKKKPTGPRSRRSLLTLAVVLLFIAIGSILTFSLLTGGRKTGPPIGPSAPEANPGQETVLEEESKPGSLPPNASLAAEILEGKDGVKMRLIPAGKVELPAQLWLQAGTRREVDSFYLDETQVTNHQYVEFLNRHALPGLKVDGGVVRDDSGNIWMFLGEVLEGYEPIVFKDGKFRIKNSAHAACPVLRVTAYGAQAYVRFYGERLPTESEWLLALGKGSIDGGNPKKVSSEESRTMEMDMARMHEGMYGQGQAADQYRKPRLPFPFPVMLFKPNQYGIRGLNESVGEWAIRTWKGTSKQGKVSWQFVVLGGVPRATAAETTSPTIVPRHPWEAFEEVGFRGALSLTGQR
ncbi:MAG: protein kinase [Deltaproteobacteria bacterium]|nr:protein kinase [Deltaproteobacteria bacterium]MBW2072197.1 protein kinase [Deltaproteobacteria bacterium]